ncbi:MAG: hypothetical protein GX322_02735 [Firmicutes bacterium]|nr:hypothetical protein [Bacillota bacterium]
MGRKDTNTRILAVVGTVLVWFPLAATIAITVIGSITGHGLRLDWLLPAELFPVAFVGGGLLFWAALRAHLRQQLIGWGLGIATGVLVGAQMLAVATGLASGKTKPTAWAWALMIGSMAIYSIALLGMGIAGVLLIRDLFNSSE